MRDKENVKRKKEHYSKPFSEENRNRIHAIRMDSNYTHAHTKKMRNKENIEGKD